MKTLRSVVLVLFTLLSMIFVIAGSGKFDKESFIADNFIKWGYSHNFMYLIGLGEVIGGIGLLIPRIRTHAVIILAVIMLGAIYTHLMNFDQLGYPLLPAFLFMVILTTYVIFKTRINQPKSPDKWN